ncbi:MAG TPA: transposase [Gemmatimonadales bacterium]
MPVRIYVHITWTTFERRPMIRQSVLRLLVRFIPAEVARHGGRLLALGIVADHVHVVLAAPARFDIPRLVQGLKGASARLVNAQSVSSPTGLRWAKGYDGRSVSPGKLRDAIMYVRAQAQRHPDLAVE